MSPPTSESLLRQLREDGSASPEDRQAHASAIRANLGGSERRILIADDEPTVRLFCRYALQTEGLPCDEAVNGRHALAAFQQTRYDLVLLDVDMPEMDGLEVCQQLRKRPLDQHLKVIMFSGRASPDELALLLLNGADDYLTKPFTITQLQSRVKAALRLKDAQERSDQLTRDLLAVNQELERHLRARDSDLVQARNALVLALAKLVECRDTETGAHLLRLQNYSRRLANAARAMPSFAGHIDDNYVEMLACCAPLHDIGKVGLPDHILLKPATLDPDERLLMQKHTVLGADTLREVAQQHPFALAFLQMATDIARHHHERFDGRGYPDRLVGDAIPLSARIVAIGDVYDALRSRRVYKPAHSHAATVEQILSATGQFDPALVQAFETCAADFERIFEQMKE
jgi:response regulator RpfG family c-di-GMP phosphodiesterase